MRFHISLIFLFLIGIVSLKAQQLSAISHFDQNLIYYNPAVTGREEALTANFFYRLHWVGMKGTPSTGVFSVHAPMKKPSVALGISLDNQSVGSTGYTGIFFNYAYRIKFRKSKVSFGIKGGIRSASRSMPYLEDSQADVAFSDQNQSYILPNFGIGVLYSMNDYWVSLSVPVLLGESTNGSGKYVVKVKDINRDFILSAGGKYLVYPDVTLAPAFLLLYNTSSSVKVAIKAMGSYKETFHFGLGYRNEGAMIFIAGYNIDRRTRFTYSFDLNFGELSTFSSGSHEFSMKYSFGYKVNAANPRGF
jgi:type IX secretion system PorP/SprF family membrane protein